MSEKYRIFKAKLIRILPEGITDSILEKKYKKILGNRIVEKLKPGSLEAAPGDNKNVI